MRFFSTVVISWCVAMAAHSYALQSNVVDDNVNAIVVGSVIKVPLASLHPTQSVIAHDQVNYKLALYRDDREQLFSDLCKNAGWGGKVTFNAQSVANQPNSYRCVNSGTRARKINKLKTAVLGPNNQLYLTDGHHTFSTFHDMPQGGPNLEVTVYVQAKIDSHSATAFWQQMASEGNAWLYNARGNKIKYQAMPRTLGRANLQNDPYRAAMYFLRDSVWTKPKPAIPFVEFYWAQYLRAQTELVFPGYYTAAEYLQWLERIQNHLVLVDNSKIIFGNFTAKQLGWQGSPDYTTLKQLLCVRAPQADKLGALGIALTQRGMPLHCDKRQYLNRIALDTGLQELPPALNADASVNVMIEIAAGSNAKLQQSKAHPLQLEWELKHGQLREVQYLAYPANYGIITNTLLAKEDGGDGDPLDVLVLGKALPQGIVQKVRVIAVMRMLDNGEQDDKLLAVPLNGLFSNLHDLDQLQNQYPGLVRQLQHWFEHYKGASGNVTVKQIEGASAAMALLTVSALLP
jgi:inorganic pyrophosphatase